MTVRDIKLDNKDTILSIQSVFILVLMMDSVSGLSQFQWDHIYLFWEFSLSHAAQQQQTGLLQFKLWFGDNSHVFFHGVTNGFCLFLSASIYQ